MARRTPARRRSPRRPNRRSRRGGSDSTWVGALGAAFVIFAGVIWISEIIGRYWQVIVAVVILALAGVVGVLVMRQRMIGNRRQEFIQHISLEQIDRMTGDQFEMLIAELLRRDGFHRVRQIGGSGDGGVDIVAVSPAGERFVIQCKRWARSVGAPEIRNLLGALHAYPGHRGVLVTSANFTGPATTYASSTNLVLINRARLTAWLSGAYVLAPPTRTWFGFLRAGGRET